jgi:phosphoribulokinase
MATVRPLVLAVGGDSGTGKTTLTGGLNALFGATNILHICLDDYHLLDRAARQRAGITALNPAANDLAAMEEHIWALREGHAIDKPVYDHTTGTFGAPVRVEPRPVVIVRGLFPLFTERLRGAFDVGIWLDPDQELKYHWKVNRDVAQRGYLLEQVISQIVERQADLRRFIHPQQAHADVVVRFYPPAGYLQARVRGAPVDRHLHVQLIRPLRRIRQRLNPADVLEAASDAARPALREREGTYKGEPGVILEIDGDVAPAMARALEERIWAHLPHHRHLRPEDLGMFLRDGRTPTHSDPLALTQLVVAYRLLSVRADAPFRGTPSQPPHAAVV